MAVFALGRRKTAKKPVFRLGKCWEDFSVFLWYDSNAKSRKQGYETGGADASPFLLQGGDA